MAHFPQEDSDSDSSYLSTLAYSSDSSDEEGESCEEQPGVDAFGIAPYMFEPERDSFSSGDVSDTASESGNEELVLGRAGNNDWCLCGNCRENSVHKKYGFV